MRRTGTPQRVFATGLFTGLLLGMLSAAVAWGAELTFYREAGTGRVTAMRRDPILHAKNRVAAAARISAVDARARALSFLAANGEGLGLSRDPDAALSETKNETDDLGLTHFRYEQTYRGLKVFGSDIRVHLDQNGDAYYATIKATDQFPASTTPRLSEAEAKARALAAATRDPEMPGDLRAGAAMLLVVPLGVVNNTRSADARLAWQVQIESPDDVRLERLYIDAESGEVLLSLSDVCQLNRRVFDCLSKPYVGTSLCSSGNAGMSNPAYVFGRREGQAAVGPFPHTPQDSTDTFTGNVDTDSVFTTIKAISDYLFATHNRNGANNLGGIGVPGMGFQLDTQTCVYVHSDYRGFPSLWPAALLNTEEIYLFKGAAVPNIIGHEYAHAIQNSDVLYTNSGQTGALAESYSDVYGAVIEHLMTGVYHWSTEFPASPGFPGYIGRSISDPSSRFDAKADIATPYPDRRYSPNVYCGTADRGGEHHNSTIPSYACYLMAVGGDFNGCHINAIGLDAVENILYRAWLMYVSSTASFNEAYADYLQAAADLYDPGTVAQVRRALQAVELDQAGACDMLAAVAPECATVDVPPSVHGPSAIEFCGPNPVRQAVQVRYSVGFPGRVNVEVHDAAGRVVARPQNAWELPGVHEAVWDGTGEDGKRRPGVYFLRVMLDGHVLGSRQLIVLR